MCDLPKPEQYLNAFKMNVGTNDKIKVYTRVCAPKGLKSSMSWKEQEDLIPEFVEGDITVHEGGVFDEEYEKTIFDDYTFGDLLGRGVFGSVRLAKSKLNDTEEDFAIKSMVNSVDYAHQIRNEIETLRVVSGKHPNLPTLIAVYEDKSRKLSVVASYISSRTPVKALLCSMRFRNVKSSTNAIGDWLPHSYSARCRSCTL